MCSCIKLSQYIAYLGFIGGSNRSKTLRLDHLEVVITEELIIKGAAPDDQLLLLGIMESPFNGLMLLRNGLKKDKMPVVLQSSRDSGNCIKPILVIQVAEYPASNNTVIIT